MERMSGGTRLLILDGRPPGDHHSWPLPPLLDCLERRGFQSQVLCTSRGVDLASDPRALEVPSLKKRMLRPFGHRWMWSDSRLERPNLLHALDDQMADVALALSETGQVPYVQTVAAFATVERGLKLSRRWCGQLVATDPDLAYDLVHELGIPRDGVVLIERGIIAGGEPLPRKRVGTIPVIGAGGPVEELSGPLVFTEAARSVLESTSVTSLRRGASSD